MAAPAAPTATVAGALFLAREALVEMDVPTRQSYVMAIVRPQERALASSVTSVTRNVAWAIGPSFAGIVMQHIALAGLLFIGGTLRSRATFWCMVRSAASDPLMSGRFRLSHREEDLDA